MSTTSDWLLAPARAQVQLLARLRNPALHLALLGGLTWLCYLHLALRYPLPALVARYPLTDFAKLNGFSPSSLADFLLSIFGAFSLYLAAWRITARWPQTARRPAARRLWPIVMVSTLVAVTLLFMYPITATDLFDYVFHSRIFVHYGQNPLVVAPSVFTGDSFYRFVTWRSQPTPYGALWVLLTAPGTYLAGNDLILNLYAMKLAMMAAHLGTTLLVWAILGRTQPGHQMAGTLLFAWNPLVLFETAGNGHNDMLMMFFTLLAVYLLVRKKWLWVLPALLVAVLVKYAVVLLVLPFLIYCLKAQNGWRNRLRFLGLTVAVCLPLLVVVAPFYWAIPRGLVHETDFYSLLAAPTLVFNFVKFSLGVEKARAVTVAASLAAYAPVYVFSLRRVAGGVASPQRLAIWSAGLVAAYLALACVQFQPWFVMWPIALGIWIDHTLTRRLLLAFTAAALASYGANFFWNWNVHNWQNFQVNAMFVAVIFAPPLVVWLHAVATRNKPGLIRAAI